MHSLASDQAVAGGMGGISFLGLGYLERQACFWYHGITELEIQEFCVRGFQVIEQARSEGKGAGTAALAEERERERPKGKR